MSKSYMNNDMAKTKIVFFSFNQWRVPLQIINELVIDKARDKKIHIVTWKKSLVRDPGYLNSYWLQKFFFYFDRPRKLCDSLASKFEIEFESNLIYEPDKINFEVNKLLPRKYRLSVNEILNLEYEDFNIGNSILSTLGTHMNFPIHDKTFFSRISIKAMLKSYLKVYLSTVAYIERSSITEAYIFNGRFLHDKAAENACLKKGIDFFTFEISEDPQSYYLTSNATLYNPLNFKNLALNAYYENFSSTNVDSLLQTWFDKKAQVYFTDSNPKPINNSELTFFDSELAVVFFGSSMDESMYLEESRDSLFADQSSAIKGLRDTLRTFYPELKFIVRSHPRMINRPKVELKKWESFIENEIKPDIHIKSSDSINSYDLIRRSKYIAMYKSSIGLEANYLGKAPLILGQNTFSMLPGLNAVRSEEDISKFFSGDGLAKTDIGLKSYLLYFEKCKQHFKNNIIELESKQKIRSIILKYESYVYLRFHLLLHTLMNL